MQRVGKRCYYYWLCLVLGLLALEALPQGAAALRNQGTAQGTAALPVKCFEGFLHVQAAEADEVDVDAVILRLAQPADDLGLYLRLKEDGPGHTDLKLAAQSLGFGVPVVACGRIGNDGAALPVLHIGLPRGLRPVERIAGSDGETTVTSQSSAFATRAAATADVATAAEQQQPAAQRPQQQQLGVLFLLLSSTCEGPWRTPAATKEQMERVLFAPAAASTAGASAAAGAGPAAAGSGGATGGADAARPNLQSYIDYCSNGRAALSRETSAVLEDIKLPCTGPAPPASASDGALGQQPAGSWKPTGCGFGELLAWGDAAVAAAKAQLGEHGLRRYRHVVVVLPKNWKNGTDPAAGCGGFMATAEAGIPRANPDGTPAYGMVWVSGDRYDSPNAYLHELSHNLGLYHAGTPNGCQYCDRSCAVSYCCVARCHNAAHLWALGWADPLPVATAATAAVVGSGGGALALEGMPEGVVLPYRLPAQHSSDASFIMIDASQGGDGTGVRYFLSYRQPSPLYDALSSADANMVHVHARLPPAARMGTADTLQHARLGGGGGGAAAPTSTSNSTWRDNTTRLVVTALAWERGYAVVAICRAPLRAGGGGGGAAAAAAGATASDASGGGSGGSASALVTAGAGASGAASDGGSAAVVDWAACSFDAAAVLRAMTPPSPPAPSPPAPSMPAPPAPLAAVEQLAASAATSSSFSAASSSGSGRDKSLGGHTAQAGRVAQGASNLSSPRPSPSQPPSPVPSTPPPVPTPPTTAATTTTTAGAAANASGGKVRGGGRDRSAAGQSLPPSPPPSLPPPPPLAPPSSNQGTVAKKRGLSDSSRDAVVDPLRSQSPAAAAAAGAGATGGAGGGRQRRRRRLLGHRRVQARRRYASQ
ncbi:hypothetical protein HYH02_008159 [Chlamydomonas schloesseri]|uniref:Peptidase M11 gametolysin domain-containing protein n=1 Tax=Chlamydomonas schloesseri TaxID=2026947 RepID=A0A836B3Z4_9CHLO|nr:hypothetical protein HYH02_008159 [Chlamydomonas schloesseri]|eukprot:KAG2447005.1 hypothetical protein HYH02_008159 [Chlamydomonas schloesseri]